MSSAVTVSQVPQDNFGSAINSAMSQATQISQANSAASNAMALEQRNWQERMMQKQMEYNTSEAAKNRDWQQLMSNTAHQREIQDLQAAGLNPILSAMGGQGASVGSGATAASASAGTGSKGEVDMSANNAIVNLLTSWLDNVNQLQMQQNSARSNEAVADKYTAMSELVAHLSGQYGMKTAGIYGANALQNTYAQGQNALNLADRQHQNQMSYAEANPNNMYQLIAQLINGFTDKTPKDLAEELAKELGIPNINKYLKDMAEKGAAEVYYGKSSKW